MNVSLHNIVSRFARARAIRQIVSEAEIPLRYAVRQILKDEANPPKSHTMNQYNRTVDDVNSRPRDRRAMSAYDTGVAVDQMAKEYMRDHGSTYRQALSALIKLEEAQEQEARAEFDRRVSAYQDEFNITSYNRAAEMVAQHDPNMVAAYAEATDLPVSIGEIVSAAKRAAGVARVSLQDAVRQILEGQRDTAKRVAGDWMDHRARIEINNMNLGSSVDRAYSIALRIVMRMYPEVNAMYETGTVSELAMKTIFVQWFK
jgi:hypothetical protein